MVSEPRQTVTVTVGPARPRLVTADQVREHLGSNSPVTDELLTRLIEEADAEVVSRYGPHKIDGPLTDVLRGGSVRLFPSQAVEGITSVTETAWDTVTGLSPDDYRTWYGGRMLERLSNGSHPRADWGERVELTYTPVDTDHQRRMAIIRLVQLGLSILRATVGERGSVQRPEPRLREGAGGHSEAALYGSANLMSTNAYLELTKQLAQDLRELRGKVESIDDKSYAVPCTRTA